MAPIAQLVKGRLSDAGGLRFESQAGRVTGTSIPSLWRDKHPAIKGLRPPEHHVENSIRTKRLFGSNKHKQYHKQQLTVPQRGIRKGVSTKTETRLSNSNVIFRRVCLSDPPLSDSPGAAPRTSTILYKNYTMIYYVMLCYTILTILYYDIPVYYILLYCTILCCTILYYTILY